MDFVGWTAKCFFSCKPYKAEGDSKALLRVVPWQIIVAMIDSTVLPLLFTLSSTKKLLFIFNFNDVNPGQREKTLKLQAFCL